MGQGETGRELARAPSAWTVWAEFLPDERRRKGSPLAVAKRCESVYVWMGGGGRGHGGHQSRGHARVPLVHEGGFVTSSEEGS